MDVTDAPFSSGKQKNQLQCEFPFIYFLHSYGIDVADDLVRFRGVRLCCHLLAHLSSHSPPARSLALRELLEGSLFHSHSHLFGAKLPSQIRAPREDVKLLHENHKQVR
jgi:hypothetical protein